MDGADLRRLPRGQQRSRGQRRRLDHREPRPDGVPALGYRPCRRTEARILATHAEGRAVARETARLRPAGLGNNAAALAPDGSVAHCAKPSGRQR